MSGSSSQCISTFPIHCFKLSLMQGQRDWYKSLLPSRLPAVPPQSFLNMSSGPSICQYSSPTTFLVCSSKKSIYVTIMGRAHMDVFHPFFNVTDHKTQFECVTVFGPWIGSFFNIHCNILSRECFMYYWIYVYLPRFYIFNCYEAKQ